MTAGGSTTQLISDRFRVKRLFRCVFLGVRFLQVILGVLGKARPANRSTCQRGGEPPSGCRPALLDLVVDSANLIGDLRHCPAAFFFAWIHDPNSDDDFSPNFFKF